MSAISICVYFAAFFNVGCYPSLDCCLLGMPPVFIGDQANMTIHTTNSNLSYQWWTGNNTIIDYNSTKFSLQNGNKVCTTTYSAIL